MLKSFSKRSFREIDFIYCVVISKIMWLNIHNFQLNHQHFYIDLFKKKTPLFGLNTEL